jgi:hypothetical protein
MAGTNAHHDPKRDLTWGTAAKFEYTICIGLPSVLRNDGAIKIARSEQTRPNHQPSDSKRACVQMRVWFEPSATCNIAMLARAECAADATAHHASARLLWRER